MGAHCSWQAAAEQAGRAEPAGATICSQEQEAGTGAMGRRWRCARLRTEENVVDVRILYRAEQSWDVLATAAQNGQGKGLRHGSARCTLLEARASRGLCQLRAGHAFDGLRDRHRVAEVAPACKSGTSPHAPAIESQLARQNLHEPPRRVGGAIVTEGESGGSVRSAAAASKLRLAAPRPGRHRPAATPECVLDRPNRS